MRTTISSTFVFLLVGCGNQPFSAPQGLDAGRDDPSNQDVFLLITTIGSGEVSPPGGRMETGTVDLYALPDDGWVFDHWEADVQDILFNRSNPLRVLLDEDMSLTAVFTREVVEPVATVEDVLNATWLIVAGNSEEFLTATAFGVGANKLATNGHVTDGLKDLFRRPGAVAQVIQHETGDSRDILKVWTHPAYDANAIIDTPDLGLIEVAGTITGTLTVANEADVRTLRVFDAVSLCGFPGNVLGDIDLVGLSTGSFHPRSTCLTGTISALRPLDPGAVATPFNTELIQYDLPTAVGTSGSAVFDESGAVVGVNFSGFSGDDFNFAIRADRLTELINMVETNQLEGIELSSIEPVAPDPIGSQCTTAYFNEFFGFGFNPPTGWSGPVADSLTTGLLLAHRFDAPARGAIWAEVWTSSSTDPTSWIALLLADGSTLLENEQFLTESGFIGYYLVFLRPDGVLWYESNVYTNGLQFKLFSPIFPSDPTFLASAVEVSLKSLCVKGANAKLPMVVDVESDGMEHLWIMAETAQEDTDKGSR